MMSCYHSASYASVFEMH